MLSTKPFQITLTRVSGISMARAMTTLSPSVVAHDSSTAPQITKKYKNDEIIANADNTFITHYLFTHPGYRKEEMEKVAPEHRPVRNLTDSVAYATMRTLRFGFDLMSGYKHADDVSDADIKRAIAEGHPERYTLTPEQWLKRFIFLESIAGVPGSVAGFLRHLASIRLLRRDKAFIETLLEEAYNERMHLLTFMRLGKPGWFMRSLLFVGQGVFCNIFFFMYILSPKACHRFVGYLEEEAVTTYSRCLRDFDKGLLDGFNEYQVPDIAKTYWRLDESVTMRDLINYIRADEAKHAEVNHSFANLKLNGVDRNPFAMKIPDITKPQPSKGLETLKITGWERDELIL